MSEPYYQDEHVTLWHGDCREVTAWLEADVLVTDPPYGLSGNLSMSGGPSKLPGHRATYKPASSSHQWDRQIDVRDAVITRWGDRPYAVFGSPRRLDLAPPHRQAPLIWDKGESVGMGDTTFPWKPSYELIFVSGEGWAGPRESSVIHCPIRINTANDIGHPTPKPVGLMERIINKAPNGTVADPFAGSGSTLLAAKQIGRRAIGVELDEGYCEIAARRLSQDVLDFGASALDRHALPKSPKESPHMSADDRKRIEDLIERSSLGTPAAKEARGSVSDEQVARVMARVRELEAEGEVNATTPIHGHALTRADDGDWRCIRCGDEFHGLKHAEVAACRAGSQQ